MKAEELRIGNRIENGIVVTIQYIEGVWGCIITQSTFSSGHDWQFIPEAGLKPIQLTEDWIKRFGFVHEGGSGYKSPHNTEYWYFTLRNWFKPNTIARGSTESDGYIGCQYVHQLQNMYFAVTGKELELK